MTDIRRSSISPLDFVIRSLGVSFGLMVIANLLASGFNLRLGLALFILGILAMGIGNLLGLPARRYERRCGIRHINLFKLPAPEEYIAENRFTAKRAASFYCFENVLLLLRMRLFIYLHSKCKYVTINYLYSIPMTFVFPMYFSVPKTCLSNAFFFVFPMHFYVPKTCFFNALSCHGAFSHHYNKLIIFKFKC